MVKILIVSLLLAVGCTATSTHPDIDSGCPPGQIRVEDEDTGRYDCATEDDYRDFGDDRDERSR
ncbi:MAG: hypothetical protein OEV34_06630 [Gammaproteobacteria bacterium]|nr:hypothetical protein [Gammaproteobacteria bacterium]